MLDLPSKSQWVPTFNSNGLLDKPVMALDVVITSEFVFLFKQAPLLIQEMIRNLNVFLWGGEAAIS